MSNFNKSVSEDWDTEYVSEFATDFLDFEANRLKVKPVPEIVRTGLQVGEPIARVWVNDFLFNHGQYIKWLSGEPVIEKDGNQSLVVQVENFEPVGTIKAINQTVRQAASNPNGGNFSTFTTADAALYWGGTWSSDSGTPVETFTKTSIDIHPDLV